MKSKFLGKTFDGWTVAFAENIDTKHKRFFLTGYAPFFDGDDIISRPAMMMVRDNEMTALANGKTSIANLIVGKCAEAAHNIRVFQNHIFFLN